MIEGGALFLFLAVASVALFSFLAVSVWTDARKKEREAYYRGETVKKIAESQGAGATSALELLREQHRIATLRTREGVKLGGLIMAAVGIGVMVMLRGLERHEPVYLAGLVPLLDRRGHAHLRLFPRPESIKDLGRQRKLQKEKRCNNTPTCVIG